MGRRKSLDIDCSNCNSVKQNSPSIANDATMPNNEGQIKTTDINRNACIKNGKAETAPADAETGIRMKKQIGLLEAVALLVGAIIGSGIFVTPKGVFQEMNTVGGSLVVWLVCGLVSMSGALCFIELGTAMPTSGSCYYYLLEVLGPAVAFLYLWAQVVIFIPAGHAILGLAFANYVVQIFFPTGCTLPESALKLIAAAAMTLLVFLNCYNVRGITRLQNVLMFSKITPLVFIIAVGILTCIQEDVSKLEQPFESTNLDLGNISLALYSSFFAYGGWGVLNMVTEEIKNPTKNMPRAIYISVPIVTMVYMLANLGYFAVLSPAEIKSGDAIAATFAKKILNPYWAFLMPCFVAFSTFGGLSIHVMSSSRQLFVGARHGQFPSILAQISVNRLTPDTSLIFLGLLSLLYLMTSDIYALINYTSYLYNVTQIGVIIVIFYIRRKKSKYDRPVKVSILHPLIYTAATVFLLIFPLYAKPIESCVGLAVGLTGLPVYYIFIKGEWKRPSWSRLMSDKVSTTIQKIFICVPEDENRTNS